MKMCHCPLATSTNFFHQKAVALHVNILPKLYPESIFVNLLRSPGIDSQPGGMNFFSSESIPRFLKRLQIRALT
jgi:hypothetical protein